MRQAVGRDVPLYACLQYYACTSSIQFHKFYRGDILESPTLCIFCVDSSEAASVHMELCVQMLLFIYLSLQCSCDVFKVNRCNLFK